MKLLAQAVSATLAVAVTVGGAVAAPGQEAAAAACVRATGPFTQARAIVRQSNGSPYVPYGITVSGLAHANWTRYTGDDLAEIEATADSFWCGDTVRLQVGQDNMFNSGGSVNTSFLGALENEVTKAEGLGLVVVINAQTEDMGMEPMPTTETEDFWRVVSGVYGQDPKVVYDIFNEPRLGAWLCWHNGGSACAQVDKGVTYIGMQALASYIRGLGAKNLLWVEGPHAASTLSEVTKHPIGGVNPMAYAIHHPAGAHDVSQWNIDFGYLKRKKLAPVVVGEWTNYASSKSECWTDAPAAVPAFISYLRDNGIGITAWTLEPGVLIESTNLDDPTHINTSTWKCVTEPVTKTHPYGLDQGAGHQLATFYEHQNG